MQALGFKQHGDLSVMQMLTLKTPKPKPDEVLIDVKASAINRLDLWVRVGWPALNLSLPHISGSDAAGVVKECGSLVRHLKPGDRVALDPGINLYEDEYTANGENSVSPGYRIIGEHLPGTHGEYIAVKEKNCLLIPTNLSFQEAAAAGLVAVTAWRMLMRQAQIRLGQKVLFIGSGGGLNSFSIQLAKLAGCEVFSIAGTDEKVKKAYQLGADLCLNYNKQPDWVKQLYKLNKNQGFDVVVDNVGKATLSKSMKMTKPGGKIVIAGNTTGALTEIDIRYIFSKQISLIGTTMGNHDDYTKAMNLVFENKIKMPIDTVYSLKEGVKAMKQFATGEHFGKILLCKD